MKTQIEKFAQLILKATNIVVLTGLGMGTKSGIADFRSELIELIYYWSVQEIIKLVLLKKNWILK